MHKNIAALILSLLPCLPVAALDQVFLEPAVPDSPVLKAQGGASTANAAGTEALFVNPASFATNDISLTILSLEGTVNVPLGSVSDVIAQRDNWGNLNITQSSNPMVGLINGLLTQSTVGGEASLVSGWVGNDLGIGLSFQARSSATGLTVLGASENIETTMQGVIGMAWPFDVGLGTLRVGGDVRPLQRSYAAIPVTAILKNMTDLSAYTVSSGFGMGWDMGARWDYADFKTGLVIRDVGSTVVNFNTYNASQWSTSFGFPIGGTSSGSTLYRVPTVIGLGTTWAPDLGTLMTLFRPSVSFDFQIPIEDQYTQPSFWTWTHLGTEVLLLQFLSVRAGLNEGYFTFGLGTKVLFMDLNVAVYTDELGRTAGSSPRAAIATQLAFQL